MIKVCPAGDVDEGATAVLLHSYYMQVLSIFQLSSLTHIVASWSSEKQAINNTSTVRLQHHAHDAADLHQEKELKQGHK